MDTDKTVRYFCWFLFIALCPPVGIPCMILAYNWQTAKPYLFVLSKMIALLMSILIIIKSEDPLTKRDYSVAITVLLIALALALYAVHPVPKNLIAWTRKKLRQAKLEAQVRYERQAYQEAEARKPKPPSREELQRMQIEALQAKLAEVDAMQWLSDREKKRLKAALEIKIRKKSMAMLGLE